MRKPNRALLISAGVTALAVGLTLTATRAASARSSPATVVHLDRVSWLVS